MFTSVVLILNMCSSEMWWKFVCSLFTVSFQVFSMSPRFSTMSHLLQTKIVQFGSKADNPPFSSHLRCSLIIRNSWMWWIIASKCFKFQVYSIHVFQYITCTSCFTKLHFFKTKHFYWPYTWQLLICLRLNTSTDHSHDNF